jgi:SMC interacting uncharacterized protein involved in chromosome segregation
LAVGILGACAGNPNKAEKIATELERRSEMPGDEAVGVKDGNMIVQRKVQMNEELRRIQYEVYELEDHVYGNRKFGSLGLYGVLRDCRMQLSDRKNGGDGKLKWTEPLERVTDKEDDLKLGVDEKEHLVGVTEEFLKDRITRFHGYKQILERRQDEYDEKVAICKTELESHKQKVD